MSRITEETKEISNDCKMALLAMPVIQYLPAVKQLLESFETVHFKKGEVILAQGDEGRYYYLINSGECLCTRKSSLTNSKEIILRKLITGDTFGEDALIIEIPRDLTVTAQTDVSVMRLSKQHFITLIKDPALTFINHRELQKAKSLGAILLDIREPEEYRTQHIEGSVNLPFFRLRVELKKLNPKKSFIFICKEGKFSEAAAFLLTTHNFKAAVLKGGIEDINPLSFQAADLTSSPAIF